MKKFYTDEELFNSAYQKKNKYYLDKDGVYWERESLFNIIEEVLNQSFYKKEHFNENNSSR